MQSQIASISPPSLPLPLSIGPCPRLSLVFLSSSSTILLSLKALQSLDYKFPSSFFSSYCFTINLALWSVLSLQFLSYLHAFLLLELCQCFTPPPLLKCFPPCASYQCTASKFTLHCLLWTNGSGSFKYFPSAN